MYEKNEQMALDHLEEAQKYTRDVQQILTLKTEIYMRIGDKVSAENHCNMILKFNPNNDFASCKKIIEILLYYNN